MGVPRDVQEAGKWYRKGADVGDPAAQLNLAAWLLDAGGSLCGHLERLKSVALLHEATPKIAVSSAWNVNEQITGAICLGQRLGVSAFGRLALVTM